MKTIKTKFAALLFAFACAAALAAAPGKALAADFKVAVVDLRSVANQHPIYMQWQADVLKQKADREKTLEAQIKAKYNLPDDPKQANLTAEQQQEIQQYLYDENQRFLDEIQPQRDQKMQEVEDNILAVVKTVSQRDGYSLVLDSAVVLFGGTDITKTVVDEVKKANPQ